MEEFKARNSVKCTIEAKYIATSNVTQEAILIKKFIIKLGVVPNIVDPVDLYCDNNRVITQIKEPISHQQSKHILQHFHLIYKIIGKEDVKI